MPELPEVETIRRDIEPLITNHFILKTKVHNVNLRWSIDERIIKLEKQQVISVQRRAKYLLFELTNGWIIIHFGMSGCLKHLSKFEYPEKHDHIDLIMSNGCIIRYNDPRRFGSWRWTDNIQSSHILTNLGPEPFSKKFNGFWLFYKSRKVRIPIKPWLMNNKSVVGVGNIYANESLFAAGILPNRLALSLKYKEATVLANIIKMILMHSIEEGGTTLRSFLRLNNKIGNFKKKLKIYGRDNKPCLICNNLIISFYLNQRITFFCPNCQR